MTKKRSDNSVGGVGGLKSTRGVKETDAVKSVEGISATGGVGAVSRATSSGRRSTRLMTLEEREKLFALIDEEANKLLASGKIPESKRQLVKEAVKMAVDSGLVDESGSAGGGANTEDRDNSGPAKGS